MSPGPHRRCPPRARRTADPAPAARAVSAIAHSRAPDVCKRCTYITYRSGPACDGPNELQRPTCGGALQCARCAARACAGDARCAGSIFFTSSTLTRTTAATDSTCMDPAAVASVTHVGIRLRARPFGTAIACLSRLDHPVTKIAVSLDFLRTGRRKERCDAGRAPCEPRTHGGVCQGQNLLGWLICGQSCLDLPRQSLPGARSVERGG